jgi:hypothetical protein
MWIIFRDPNTIFLDMDKYVASVIADDDILAFQTDLIRLLGGRPHTIDTDVYFLQPFATSEAGTPYFARRYKAWLRAAPSVDADSHSQK